MASTTGTPTLDLEPKAAGPEPGPAAAGVLDTLTDATPAHRDRVVDLFRAVSIGVVVLWHWTFSITHWGNGSLRMPNPIGDVPGLWAATWVLQVMPLFFLVGGYSNLAGWRSVTRSGDGSPAQQFWARRFSRLARPVAVYVTCWTVIDLAWQASGGSSVLSWGMVVFVPLWFLGVYVAVVALVPLTARLHGRRPVQAVVALAAGILAADVVRLSFGVEAAGLVTSALVWVFCHQLGYFWHDWSQSGSGWGGGSVRASGRRAWWAGWADGDPAGPAGIARRGRSLAGSSLGVGTGATGTARRGRSLALAGVVGLLALTTAGPYPRSMVAVRGEELSNMFPTTACVALLAVLQLGLVLWLRAPLGRWLERRAVWKGVIAANSVAMTVFCWHMTALVGFLLAYEAVGFTLATQPTAGWWLARPLWVVGPGILLAGLLTVFARFERPALGNGKAKPKRRPPSEPRSFDDSKTGVSPTVRDQSSTSMSEPRSFDDVQTRICMDRRQFVLSRRGRAAGRGRHASDRAAVEGLGPPAGAGRAAAGGDVQGDQADHILDVQSRFFFPPFGV